MDDDASSPEPIYIAQADKAHIVVLDGISVQEWLKARFEEGRAKGCTYGRVTEHPDNSMILVEGWAQRPQDEGQPRFATQ